MALWNTAAQRPQIHNTNRQIGEEGHNMHNILLGSMAQRAAMASMSYLCLFSWELHYVISFPYYR